MRQEGLVSLWMGTAPSEEALVEYVELGYDEDGEIVPSRFMVDFQLEQWNEDFREVDFLEEHCTTAQRPSKYATVKVRSSLNSNSRSAKPSISQ
jgi:hypothetical protein